MKSPFRIVQRRIGFLLWMVPRIGLSGARLWVFVSDWNRVARKIHAPWCIRKIPVWPKGYGKSVAMRVGSSDLGVFDQILIQQQYMPVTRIKDAAVIVDCGANAGYSSLFFLKHFPHARVIALEPDPLNAELCRHNLRRYGDRILILQKAIWGSVGKLTFVKETRKPGEEWGIQVQAGPTIEAAGMVEGIDIPNLMIATGLKHIDLLKIDIEKSEADVFHTNPAAWLSYVRNIAIELHGPVCAEIFHSALSNYSFLEEQCGEVTLCLGIQPKRKGSEVELS